MQSNDQSQTEEEYLANMHWKDRWEYEARQTQKLLIAQSEPDLLSKIETGQLDPYYQIWHAIGEVGRLETSWQTLWKFLKDHPGENYMLDRYHCAAALFKLMGYSDTNEDTPSLREQVQWDHQGEEARQKSLRKLKDVIKKQL